MIMKCVYNGDKLTISPLYPRKDKLPFITHLIIENNTTYAVSGHEKIVLGSIPETYHLLKIDNKYREIIFSTAEPSKPMRKKIKRDEKLKNKINAYKTNSLF